MEINDIFDIYFRTCEKVYKSNRYVSIKKAGFKPGEEEIAKIIEQRVEGVDSFAHEMNTRMLYIREKLKDGSKTLNDF